MPDFKKVKYPRCGYFIFLNAQFHCAPSSILLSTSDGGLTYNLKVEEVKLYCLANCKEKQFARSPHSAGICAGSSRLAKHRVSYVLRNQGSSPKVLSGPPLGRIDSCRISKNKRGVYHLFYFLLLVIILPSEGGRANSS